MRICDRCGREYTDPLTIYCLQDGTPLTSVSDAERFPSTLIFSSQPESPSSKRQPSIAVLPFANISKDPENEYFCDGLAEELLNSLAKIRELKVVARTSAFAFKGKEIDVRDIGRQLDVGAILEGSVRRSGDRLRIAVQLIDIKDGYQIWSEQFDRLMDDIFVIEDEISLAVINGLKLKLLGDGKSALLKRYTESTEAHELYLKGRYHQNKWTSEGIKKSIELFSKAIAMDPDYALAYAGLADSYAGVGVTDALDLPVAETSLRAKAAATRALELDDSLSEAHTSLGLVELNYEWDWDAANKEFTRSLELNPNNVIGHHWYSHLLIALGRMDESLAISNRALELDPLDLEINTHLVWHYYFARDYDRAIEQGLKTVELDAGFLEAHIFLGWAYEQKGLVDEAMDCYRKASSLNERPDWALAWLGRAYALIGDNSEARKYLKKLAHRKKNSYSSPYFAAIIHLALNEMEETFDFLNKAADERNPWLVYLKVNPLFDSLRSDARFDQLLARIKPST